MLAKEEIIKVKNRDNGSVGYTVPDLGITRQFQANEIKEISMEELRKLSYMPGGMYILKNCLLIENEEAIKELLNDVEPEYFYTEQEIKTLLLSGTLAQLQDCLDFAPIGVIDILKKYAVELEINDLAKREAILKKTGFNVTKAIEINHASKDTDKKEEAGVGRRAAPIKTTPTTRRATITTISEKK